MLRTVAVRQSPTPRTSPRRFSSTIRATQQNQRSASLYRFQFGPLIVSLFLCFAGVAVYVWPRVQVVRLAYRLQTSEAHLRELLQAQTLQILAARDVRFALIDLAKALGGGWEYETAVEPAATAAAKPQ